MRRALPQTPPRAQRKRFPCGFRWVANQLALVGMHPKCLSAELPESKERKKERKKQRETHLKMVDIISLVQIPTLHRCWVFSHQLCSVPHVARQIMLQIPFSH